MTVYNNLTARKSIRFALQKYAQNISKLNIASAFFSADDDLLEISKRGIHINLIVRLGEGTKIQALKNINKKNNINVRYYTGDKFHPKLYIFGDKTALIGSANATKSGINSNSEISITIDRENEDFDELISTFSRYWDSAMPLTDEIIKEVEALFKNAPAKTLSIDNKIEEAIGKTLPPSEIIRYKKVANGQQTYIEDYERSYQEFKTAYDKIYKIYSDYGKRKPEAQTLPIRIEIDQFWNYIRVHLTSKDSYNDEPIRNDQELVSFTRNVIDGWVDADFDYITTILENYSLISNNLTSAEALNSLSLNELFDSLWVCHAFQESMRYIGTRDIAQKEFVNQTDEQDLKQLVNYLLFNSKDRFTVRMAECIFGKFKIDYLGRNTIQELLGWVNQDGIPICNQRTMRALRYLGAVEGNY